MRRLITRSRRSARETCMPRHSSHKNQHQQARPRVGKEFVETSEKGASLAERCVSIGFVAETARSVHAGQNRPVRSDSIGPGVRARSANRAKAATQQQTRDDQTRLCTWIFKMEAGLTDVRRSVKNVDTVAAVGDKFSFAECRETLQKVSGSAGANPARGSIRRIHRATTGETRDMISSRVAGSREKIS